MGPRARATNVEVIDTSGLDLETLVDRGMKLCRENRWEEGIVYLAAVTALEPRPSSLPSAYYALLGHGLVRVQRRGEEGLALCRRAVREGFGETENHVLLVRTLWLLRRRREAFDALRVGLSLANDPKPLLALLTEIERRRAPAVSAFSRDHVVNKMLGKITYRR